MKTTLYIVSILLATLGTKAGNPAQNGSSDPTQQNKTFNNPQANDLLFFNYTSDNSAVTLKWATSSESNTESFGIERSTDGNTFNNVGEQKAAGNAAIVTSYSYTDITPAAGISYYRLKKTLNDGTFEYKGTIICQLFIGDEYSFKFTNPVVTGDLSISVTGEAANLQINIFNAIGQKILDQSVYHSNNQSDISVPFADVQKGYYIIAITTPSGRIYSFPLSKA